MKIYTDKIESAPAHGFSGRDVRLVLARVPPKWVEGIMEVRLANGKGPRAYLLHGDGQLTIYSRHGTKREVLVAVLSALAAPWLNIKNVVARSPSGPEQHRIEQFIQPLVDEILPELTPQKNRSPEAHVPWQPVPFPNDAV